MTSGFATYHLVKRRIFNQKLISRGVNLIFIDANFTHGMPRCYPLRDKITR
ncbi:Uncharacterised protein [Vibrio cholerae]|nr:Uncharacterised protein [Vibrio cholerae]